MWNLDKYDGACHKVENSLNDWDIWDSTCDALWDLSSKIEWKIFPTEKQVNGQTVFEVGWEYWDIQESTLECFLSKYPNLKLTPLGIADVLKNRRDYKYDTELVVELYDEFIDSCNLIS